jgi:SAM-dependent methyltransferase
MKLLPTRVRVLHQRRGRVADASNYLRFLTTPRHDHCTMRRPRLAGYRMADGCYDTPVDDKTSKHEYYASSSDYIAVLISRVWTYFRPALTEVLRRHSVTGGRILQIGAGTGIETAAIAEAVPEAEIYALEPSSGMRTALMARLVNDSDLRTRVTVLPQEVFGADVNGSFDAVIALNVLCHFRPADRVKFCGLLRDRIATGGIAVVNLPPPTEPQEVPESRFSDIEIGRRRYEGWARATPHAEGVTWHMTYRTLENGEVVDSTETQYQWWTCSPDELRRNLRKVGFSLEAYGPSDFGIHVAKRS